MPMQSLPYTLPSELPLHAFAVTGNWDFSPSLPRRPRPAINWCFTFMLRTSTW